MTDLFDLFEDHRGLIKDLITEPLDAVTEIFTLAGAVRGNHVHKETVQYTYVVSGKIRMVHRCKDGFIVDEDYGPGALVCDDPGVEHAWLALEDTTVLVFTRGPRSGASYEDDVQRLAPDERLIG